MKLFNMLSVVVMVIATNSIAGTVCINGDCTSSGNGSVEVRQYNGYSECIGSGCGSFEEKPQTQRAFGTRPEYMVWEDAYSDIAHRFNNRRYSGITQRFHKNKWRRRVDIYDIEDYPPPPRGQSYVYTVAPGDVLSGIALKTGCALNDLIALNKRQNRFFDKDLLTVGQKIVLSWYK